MRSTNFRPTKTTQPTTRTARRASLIESLESRTLFSAIRDLPEFTSHTIGPADDNSSAAVVLDFESPVSFFGGRYDSLFVNNNGNVTFGARLGRGNPSALGSITAKMLAPFWADVDTTFNGSPVTFGHATIDGRAAFGANWVGVDWFRSDPSHTNLNSFQLVLIDRSDTGAGNFDVEFNYGAVRWEAGELSGGVGGLGGSAGRAGFTAGTGAAGTFFELGGSGVAGAMLDDNTDTGLVHHSLNSDVLGRYALSFRNGVLSDGGNAAPTLALPGDMTLVEGPGGRTTFPANVFGSFADPDAADAWTATVDYGDGAGPQPLAPNADKTFAFDHVYTQDGLTRVVTVTVDDGNGGVASGSFAVRIEDRSAPVFHVVAPSAALEGGTVTLQAVLAGDDANDTYTFEWLGAEGHFDGDRFTFVPAQDGTYFLTVLAYDQAGNASFVDVPVVVGNAAPALGGDLASTAASPGKAKPGQAVTVTGSFADLGVLDAHAATIDWGDGTTSAAVVSEAGGAGTYAASHAYAHGGVYVVKVLLSDGQSSVAGEVKTYVTGVSVRGGQLQVVGTAGADDVSITRDGKNRLRVKADFLPGKSLTVDGTGVTQVLAALGAGADELKLGPGLGLGVTRDPTAHDPPPVPPRVPAVLSTVLANVRALLTSGKPITARTLLGALFAEPLVGKWRR